MFHQKSLIKDSQTSLVKPLTLIYQKILSEDKLRDIWKCVNVTAVFDSGDKLKPNSYRPISLTSVPGKITERIILHRSSWLHERKTLCHLVGIYGGYYRSNRPRTLDGCHLPQFLQDLRQGPPQKAYEQAEMISHKRYYITVTRKLLVKSKTEGYNKWIQLRLARCNRWGSAG